MYYTDKVWRIPPPPAAGAKYFSMDVDEEAPAAARPAPVVEVQPQAGDRRHGGIGYELVLSTTVPRVMEDEAWDPDVLIFLRAMKEEADEKEEKETGKKKQKGGAQVIPPRWISERIVERIALCPRSFLRGEFRSEFRSRKSRFQGRVLLRSELLSELRSRPSRFLWCEVFLRSEFWSELRSRLSTSEWLRVFPRSEFRSALRSRSSMILDC